MANLKLGKIMFTPKGEYDNTATYEKLDLVEYDGSAFLVQKRVTGISPQAGEYYQLIASRGKEGKVGKTAEFRYSGDALEWKYVDESDETWRALIDVAEISEYAERAAASADAAAKSAQDAVGAAGGGVSTFNGRSGVVMPQKEDYQDHYAAKEHGHSGYAESVHTHDGYASAEHNHDDKYASKAILYFKDVSATWTDNSDGSYSQTITVDGITENDTPLADIVLGDDIDTNKAALGAWSCISRITTANGSITLWAYENKPGVAFRIRLRVVR